MDASGGLETVVIRDVGYANDNHSHASRRGMNDFWRNQFAPGSPIKAELLQSHIILCTLLVPSLMPDLGAANQKDRRVCARFLDSPRGTIRHSTIAVVREDTSDPSQRNPRLYDHRTSTAPLEGTNNKIKLLQRQAFGYPDLNFFKLKLLALHYSQHALVGCPLHLRVLSLGSVKKARKPRSS